MFNAISSLQLPVLLLKAKSQVMYFADSFVSTRSWSLLVLSWVSPVVLNKILGTQCSWKAGLLLRSLPHQNFIPPLRRLAGGFFLWILCVYTHLVATVLLRPNGHLPQGRTEMHPPRQAKPATPQEGNLAQSSLHRRK